MSQARIDPGDVAAVGLTGQMHSLVAVGADGEPVRPAIIWADQRSARQVRSLAAQVGHEKLAQWAGNPLAAGFMLASWAWMRENEPGNAEKTRQLMLPKDWARLQLTGVSAAEPSDASSTLLFDPHRREWSRPLMQAVNLREEQLPPVVESASTAGGLLPEMAARAGLKAGTPVVAGCSDVTAQALAMGVIEPGVASVTTGTGGQVFSPSREPRHDPELRAHLFCHALPGLWHHEAAILSAGLSLRWLRDSVWPGSDYAQLAGEAEGAQAAMDGLYFLPFLAGERTPYMDPGLQGAFIGLGLRHGRAQMARAVMEGVVFALRQCLDLMADLGAPVEQLVASGGATRHPLWLQLQADTFNRPLLVYEAPEATARGAALLAGIGAGVYSGADEALRRAGSAPVKVVSPSPKRARLLERAYQDWRGWADLVADHYRLAEVRD